MQTLTADQFRKRYGVAAESQFDAEKKQQQNQESLLGTVKQAFNEGARQVYEGINQAAQPDQAAGNLPLGVLKAGAGVVNAATSPLAPVFAPIGKAINYVADKVSNSPMVQKFAESKAGQYVAKGAEGIQNATVIAGALTGVKGGKAAGDVAAQVPGKAAEMIPEMPSGLSKASIGEGMSRVSESLPAPLSEALGTKQSWIDHNLAVALDLTPGDLATIESSTGNPVGKWLADNNLIGTNKANTQGLINGFFGENYKAVRNEIAQVPTIYKTAQVPRYVDALTAIKSKVDGVPGLEKEARAVDNLLAKKEVNLADVQTVKEMLDEHFSLYKASGDVAQGIEKQGLANLRKELRGFIEKQVEENTGSDIRQMNNNVATARTLNDAINKRSPKGLTRSQITTRDWMMGMGLTYFGSPILGLAAVLVKKVATSPSVRLRFARYLDSLNDAQRLKISEDLAKGVVPLEVKKAVENPVKTQ